MLTLREPTSTPSTSTRPPWIASSRVTVRIRVDLPHPDGPTSTLTSPRLTTPETPASACVDPYHLSTFSNRIMAASCRDRDARRRTSPGRHAPLYVTRQRGQREAQHEIGQCQDAVDLKGLGEQHVVPLARGEGHFVGAEDVAQRGFLDGRNELTDHARQHVVEGLRQHDLEGGGPVAETKRGSSLE